MTRKKLSYREVMDGLNTAKTLNEMKAVAARGRKPISETTLRALLRGRAAENQIKMALAKPVKIGKRMTDRELKRAFPDKPEYLGHVWVTSGDPDEKLYVTGAMIRGLFRRWEEGEDFSGDDLEVWENRRSLYSGKLYDQRGGIEFIDRIKAPVRMTEDGFECGDDYSLTREKGERVLRMAMEYWAGLSDIADLTEDDDGHWINVRYDGVAIGCQMFHRKDVTRLAVEAGVWPGEAT